MTPNPDEELEAEIDEVLVDVTNVCNDCEHPRCLAQLKSGRKHIMELIKSREERLVREARVEEHDMAHSEMSLMFRQIVSTSDMHLKRAPTKEYIAGYRSALNDYDTNSHNRIAALKEGE